MISTSSVNSCAEEELLYVDKDRYLVLKSLHRKGYYCQPFFCQPNIETESNDHNLQDRSFLRNREPLFCGDTRVYDKFRSFRAGSRGYIILVIWLSRLNYKKYYKLLEYIRNLRMASTAV